MAGGEGGGEGGDFVRVGGGEEGQDFAKVGAHIDAHPFAAFDDADDGSDGRGCFRGADMEPVFAPQRNGANALFAAIVIDFRNSVFQAAAQLPPEFQAVGAGFAQGAAGQ